MTADPAAKTMSAQRAGMVVAVVCLCETLGMASYATFPALIATFQAEWGLDNTGAGWISGSYFAGVAIGTLVLPSLTDRWSGKRVYLPSMALAAVAALGFALLASGLWSGSFWRFLQGVALGGTYLPGLRALLQSIPRPHHGRGTAFYTGAFYVGASLSFFLAGVLESRFGWVDTFLWSAVGPILALVTATFVLRDHTPARPSAGARLVDLRALRGNRRALGYTVAYTVHTAELPVVHSWLVVFLSFSMRLHGVEAAGVGWTAATIVALINLAALPVSVGVNEVAGRIGRVRTISWIMVATGALGVLLAASSGAPMPLVLVLSFLLLVGASADSAALTNGLRETVDDALLGRALATYSVAGFLGGAASPFVFGALLDLGGGRSSQMAWVGAHVAMSVVFLAGPLLLRRLVPAA